MSISHEQLRSKIAELLDVFYERRIEKLQTLKLRKVLKRKNPYLFRAIGVSDASEIVQELLVAQVSSSDETLFGNEFFEPLAIWMSEETGKSRGGRANKASGEGIDLTIEYDTYYEAIAIKSGTNVYNAASKKKQGENFDQLRRRMQALHKRFDPIVGYCYGNKQTGKSTYSFHELAGQKLWEHLSGDPVMYQLLIVLMEGKPERHAIKFKEEFGNAKNRFTREFANEFCTEGGQINWEKLIDLVSKSN